MREGSSNLTRGLAAPRDSNVATFYFVAEDGSDPIIFTPERNITMNVVKAVVKAVVGYATSKDATKLERAFLAGVGVAVLAAVRSALGI